MNPKRKPGGRWWLWPFGLAVFAVLLLSLLRWLVQPERLGSFVLQRAEAASGLRLKVQGPPRLGIWPRLHLQLQQLEVSDPQLPGVRLASVDRVSLYLPLSALRGEQRIDAIALEGPQLDLQALAQRGTRQVGPPAAPWLPEISELSVASGSLLGDGWSLEGLTLELRGLMLASAPLQIEARGNLVTAEQAVPLQLALLAANPAPGEALQWTLKSLSLGDHDASFLSADQGDLGVPDWNAVRLKLRSTLAAWPAGWPALPEPMRAQLVGLELQLRYDPKDADQALHVEASGPGRKLQLAVTLGDLVDWIAAGDWLAPLPGRMALQSDLLEHQGVRIEGLRISHGTDDDD